MVDGGGGAGFIQKSIHLNAGIIRFRVQDFDCNFPVQCDIQSPVDRCHAADAAGLFQQITVKPFRNNEFYAADGTNHARERLQSGYIQFLLTLMTENLDRARVRSGRRNIDCNFFRRRLFRCSGDRFSVFVGLFFCHNPLP